MQDSESRKHIAHYDAARGRRHTVLQEHTDLSCRVSYYEKPECRQDIELKIQLERKDVKSMSLIFRSPNFAVGDDEVAQCLHENAGGDVRADGRMHGG